MESGIPSTTVHRAHSYRDVRAAAQAGFPPAWSDFLDSESDPADMHVGAPCRRSASESRKSAAAAAAAVSASGAALAVVDPYARASRGHASQAPGAVGSFGRGFDGSSSRSSSHSSFNDKFARCDSSLTKHTSWSSDAPAIDLVARSVSSPSASDDCGDCGACDACVSAGVVGLGDGHSFLSRRKSFAAPSSICPNCRSSSGWRCGCADAALACDPGWVDNARCRIREAALELVEAQQRSAAHDEELTWLEKTRATPAPPSRRASFDVSQYRWPGGSARLSGKPCHVESEEKVGEVSSTSFSSVTSKTTARNSRSICLFSSMKAPMVKSSRVFAWLYTS
ncbi:hypothetical protein CLOM_g22845 [Closterium sp. NIES-68]|nr:hypothetical protein CLOM_g22845 [Closterium sp. NIES-68]GJP85723.1 hypothetical protein CLOP_g15827 [Closterium sp. NIES-67]